jgi:hypothetical protein
VEELVREIFIALDATGSVSEMVRQFSDARHVIQNRTEAADAINVATLIALSDCVRRVGEAHRRAKVGVRMERTCLD